MNTENNNNNELATTEKLYNKAGREIEQRFSEDFPMDEYIMSIKNTHIREFLNRNGVTGEFTNSVAPRVIKDHFVLGNIPLMFAAYAKTVTVPDFKYPSGTNKNDVTVEDLEKYFVGYKTYRVELLAETKDLPSIGLMEYLYNRSVNGGTENED